jgi:2-keto-4-pentenoate hydratase/2-oxohepta-3-ene-1,7-dioic acid hydratase in catechol pathway
MKLARYIHNGAQTYGLINSQTALSLPDFADHLNSPLPPTIEQFIAAGTKAQAAAKNLLAKASPEVLAKTTAPLSDVRLLAPLAFPSKLLCLGWNYLDHTAETKTQPPAEPVVFMKPHTAIIGTGDPIVKRPFVTQLDYEGELAIVIGKKAKDVPESEALNYVFGYTILNDVSARDFQFRDKQWTRGKGFDTFAPMGPCITTRDELADLSGDVRIQTWVNGQLRQNGSTADRIFKVPQIIFHLSRVMTLEPCDVIATGTPSGVGMAMTPQTWLKDGDVVCIEIDGVGAIENPVVEA